MVFVIGAAARGADPFSWGPGETSVPVESAEEQQKFAEIESAFGTGRYDAAIESAKTFLRTAKDERLKAQVARFVAEALRKKKDWKLAWGAYVSVRDRYEKGSDEYVKYDALAEILRASPAGVYQAPAAGEAPASGNGPRTLDDDAALAEAMARLAEARLERLKVKVAAIRRARTGQEVIQAFLPLAEELRQLRILWAEVSPDGDRAAAQAAGMRLAEIGAQLVAALKGKQAVFQAATKAKQLTVSQHKEMVSCQTVCTEMAKVEETFLEGMTKLAGTVGWPEGDRLRADSGARRDAYLALGKELEPPKLGGSGGLDWRDSIWINRGGAPGRGGPGGW